VLALGNGAGEMNRPMGGVMDTIVSYRRFKVVLLS